MKLFQIGWETDDGRELIETVAAESLNEAQATRYIVELYKHIWSDTGFNDGDIYSVYVYEVPFIDGVDDKIYNYTLTERS